MSSNDEKAVMDTEVSPVVSTSSDISTSEEDKCILTPLSLEFDPLSWKLDENKSNNNSNTNSPEHCSALSADPLSHSAQSFDLLTMDDICDTNTNHVMNGNIESNAQLIKEFEPTLNCDYEANGWPNGAIVEESHLISNNSESDSEPIGWNERSTNECQIASPSNTLNEDIVSEPMDQTDHSEWSARADSPLMSMIDHGDVDSANFIAAKLVKECVSQALHENGLHFMKDPMLNSSSSLSASSLSDHMSSDSDASAGSVSSASSGSGKKKKKNTRKKASKAQLSQKSQSSAPHELSAQTSNAKNNSMEVNKKSVDNYIADKKPEMNGHSGDGEQMNGMKEDMIVVNGFDKHINDINNDFAVKPSMNGHKKDYDFDTDSLNETLPTEPDYCVNIAKLSSTYTKCDESNKNSITKGVIITGISLKTLKSQYVSHVEHESQSVLKSFPKEIANTGIDVKSLKNSYVSSVEHNVINKNALNRQLLPIGVNVNSIKSTFNSEQAMSGEKVDSHTKGSKKFAQMECEYICGNDIYDSISYTSFSTACSANKDVESICKLCAKHVYQMEKIKAEKSVFHKQCFRCKECNKQMNVDNYSSHEGELYCMPHFKQLFQPKAKFDAEDNQQRNPKRYEVIIRENTPQELPPEVVRSNTKVEDQFNNLTLDLKNIRNRFESGPEDHNNLQTNIDKSSLQRSESLHQRMQKYQSAVSGEKESNTSSDEELNDNQNEDKVVFSGLSSLKTQWESGAMSGNKDESESTKEELEALRKKLSLGRSESLKQVYERAVKESHNESPTNWSESIVFDSSAKTIKEKFESGSVDNETESEEQRVERLKREREDEIQVFAESESVAKEARNKFKEIDASATRGPTSQLNGHSNHSIDSNKKSESNGVVIKSGGPIGDDISIDSVQLQQRFSYFENLPKETQKEPKRHTMTPPRDGNVKDTYESNVVVNDNVIRSSDLIEEIPKVDTTKRMVDKFKALENQMESHSNGVPKPVKRSTPPNEHNRESTQERDPNIIQSSLKSDDDIQVEPEMTRNLKAKFENWSAEIDRENKKNNGYDDEEEFIPHIDTTKNLRAKFEAIKDEVKPVDKPKARVNRFVCETSGDNNSASDVCYVCLTKLYPMEKLEFSGIRIHKNCFRCFKCKCNLRLDNFTITAEKLYCIPHFKQLFMERGNYDEGFGLEQHKDKWNNKCINNNDLIINNNNNISTELICDPNANEGHLDLDDPDVCDLSDNDY